MTVREIDVYLARVEEVKNAKVEFMERMRRERLLKEERYANPDRKLEI